MAVPLQIHRKFGYAQTRGVKTGALIKAQRCVRGRTFLRDSDLAAPDRRNLSMPARCHPCCIRLTHLVPFFVLLALMASVQVSAQNLSLFACAGADGTITYVSMPTERGQCQLLHSQAMPDLLMAYQEKGTQYLSEPDSASLQGDRLTVAVVTNHHDESVAEDGYPSKRRVLLIECQQGGGIALLEEQAFTQPLARGVPAYMRSTPDALPQRIPPGSPDAALRLVLCGGVQS